MKNKIFYFSFLVFVFSFIITFISCSGGSSGNSGTYTVRYVISGPPTIARQVFYINETGNSDSTTNVPIPWEKTVVIQGIKGVACGASLDYDNTSTYTAKIFVNGIEKYSSTSTSVTVSVSGVVQ